MNWTKNKGANNPLMQLFIIDMQKILNAEEILNMWKINGRNGRF